MIPTIMVNALVALIFAGVGFWLGYLKGTKALTKKVLEGAKEMAALYRPGLDPDHQYEVTESRVAWELALGLEADPHEVLFCRTAAEYHERRKNGKITESEESNALRLAHLMFEKIVLANRLRELKERFKKNNMEAAWDLGTF